MTKKTYSNAIVWFDKDLRLSDHPALYHAAKQAKNVLPLFIFHSHSLQGGAQAWWLHHSLLALQQSLQKQGAELVLARGEPQQILTTLIKRYDIEAVYYHQNYQPLMKKQQQHIYHQLTDNHIDCHVFNASLLINPSRFFNKQGGYFKVFTPFWKSACQHIIPPRSHPIAKPDHWLSADSDKLDDWQLLPTTINWAKAFSKYWQPGEAGAKKKLKQFIANKLHHYSQGHDQLDTNDTSHLSPHLHFGEISPWQLWRSIKQAQTKQPTVAKHCQQFLSELGWREFCHYLLYHFPKLATKNFRSEFDNFPWHQSSKRLKAWQQGKTGYPIVDAAMQQLWQGGTMHNRARMIVASFLTKHLLIDWRKGADWFKDTLLDADLANNSANWQWVAGCGADAAPYFRIFNPILQGEKFDPQGQYVKRWLPVLQHLPNRYIHQPWQAPTVILERANIKLGSNYPLPIVDHQQARETALNYYKKLKKNKIVL